MQTWQSQLGIGLRMRRFRPPSIEVHFIIIILFIFFMFTSICIVRYQFSVLSDPTTLKDEIRGAVAEAMVSTKDLISEAVGSAILTNMRIAIREMQFQSPSQPTTPCVSNPPTPHVSNPPTPQFFLPPRSHSHFNSPSPFESPLHPPSEAILSPTDSFSYLADTPPGPYLPTFNTSATSWVPQGLECKPGPSWQPPPRLQPPFQPPPSPTRYKLKPPNMVMSQLRHKVVPASIGRVGIALARESVFGPDVMANGELSDDGLMFIKGTLR